jgi:hypothetical protein
MPIDVTILNMTDPTNKYIRSNLLTEFQFLYINDTETSLPISSAMAIAIAAIGAPINNCDIPDTENHAAHADINRPDTKMTYLNILFSSEREAIASP